ncbi:hypothetical protein PFISCL1PPCAC_27149, partial [Pristionchus fissidentatus]
QHHGRTIRRRRSSVGRNIDIHWFSHWFFRGSLSSHWYVLRSLQGSHWNQFMGQGRSPLLGSSTERELDGLRR